MKYIFFILLFSFLSPAFAEQKIIKVCWEDEEKPPYLGFTKGNVDGVDVKLQPKGFMADVINHIFEDNKDFKLQHEILPWKRCVNEGSHGDFDILENASKSPDRDPIVIYSETPIYITHLVLFYKLTQFKQPPVVKTLEDLQKYRVGGILGFNYSFYKNKINIDTNAHNRAQLIKKLNGDRFDFAVEQIEAMKNLEKEKAITLQGLGYIPNPGFYEKPYHVLFTKKGHYVQELKKAFDEGFNKMQTDGSFTKLQKKYFN